MPTIAELEVRVDSTPLERGTKALNDFAQASEKAESASKGKRSSDEASATSTRKAAQAEQDLSTVIDAQAKKLAQLADQRKKLNESSVSSTAPAEYQRLNAVIDANIELVNRQGSAIEKLAAKQASESAKREASAQAEIKLQEKLASAAQAQAEVVSRAALNQQKELDAVLAKIDPLTKKLADLAKQEEVLFANKGNLSTAAFDAYNAKLQESFDKLAGVTVAQKDVGESSDQAKARLLALATASVEAAKAQQTLGNAAKGVSEAEQGIVSSGAVAAANSRADAALKEHEAKRQLAQSTKAAADAETLQVNSLNELRNKIDPTIAKINELNRQKQELAKQRSLGNIGTEEFGKLNGVLDRNIATQTRYNAALNTTGKTAKETAFALRGLPAQFTDIVVSLQGGQNPLTVLLQQGGQVKDMFGGVGNAIKNTGTYLLTLVNPLSVTAAGLTALAYGLYAGTQETVAFNKAIIQSGGFSGTSASGLSAYRNELDSIAGTASKAAQTLTAIQASGKITDSLFLAIAESAIKLERATGESVEKIVDDFASLAKDPVNAAITLDEKYKFLTASILATADSLVKQGRQQEAVIFLQKEMSAAATTTADNLVDRAGTIEKAWRGVKDILAETLDALKSIGRQDTTQDQITILEERKAELERSIATNNTRGGGLVQKEKIAALAATEKELVQLRTRKQYEDYTATFNAEQEQARKRGVEIQRQNSSAYEANIGVIDRVAAAEISLAQVRKRGQELVAGARVRNETLSEDVIRQQQAAENAAQKGVDDAIKAKKNAAKGKPSPVDNTQVQEVKNNLDSIKSEYSNYYKEVTALGEANIVSRAATYASQKAVLEAEAKAVDDSYEQQIAAIKRLQGVKSNSAQANISLTNQLNKAESDRAKAAEANDSKQEVLAAKEKGRIDARTASIEAYNDALRQQIENTAVSGERQAAAVGKGDRQGRVDDALAENDRSFAKDQAKLAKSLSNGMDPEEYATNLKNLTDAHTAMADQIVANDARIQEANADWTNGFTKAIQNAADQGNNFADSVNRAVSGAFDSMGDALGTFVTTGKINFSDLTRSIIADMAKIAARQAASSALSSLFGAAASVAGSFFGGSTVTSTSGFSDYGTVTTQAKGGGWNGGTQFFAQGGAFTNSIVSSPTAFGMSGGNRGVMGEAGPEAIVPLARTSDGSLGVRMIGGANNQGTSSAGVNVYVNVSSEGAETSTDSSDPAYNMFGKELGDFVQSKYYTLQQKDLKDGGSLSVAIKR